MTKKNRKIQGRPSGTFRKVRRAFIKNRLKWLYQVNRVCPDCHQYLYCSLPDPQHIKKFIIYSQTLRLGIWNHGYLIGDIQNKCGLQMRKVKLDHRKNNANILSTENLFFITYYPKHLMVEQVMRKLQYLQYQDEAVKKAFTSSSMTCYRCASKLEASQCKLNYPLERKIGCYIHSSSKVSSL